MINVYEYMDYRNFLQDYYSCKKAINPSYSYTILAQNAGISSRGLVQLIVNGKRNLSLTTLPKMIQGLKLNKTEAKYFFILVRFNNAKKIEEKNELYKQLLEFKGKKKASVLGKEQYNIYAKWYYSAIYEMLSLKDCPYAGETFYKWIAKKLFGEITSKQAKDAIFDLEKVNLISLSDGKFVRNHNYVENPGEKINFAVQMFQKKVIEKVFATFERPLEERDISGITLAIKKEDIPKAKKFIAEFRKNFDFDYCSSENADNVYQLNIQFYELTDRNFTASGKNWPDAKSQNFANVVNTEI